MRLAILLLVSLAAAAAVNPDTHGRPGQPLASGVSAAAPASVAGKWKGTATAAEGRRYDVDLELSVEGEKVTGTIAAEQGSAPIEEGRVDGDQLNFKVTTDQGVYSMKLTVTGDKMKGRYTGPSGESGDLSFSR